MSKWVILSSDRNEQYSFLLPITIKTWQNLGFKPLIMLIGSEHEWNNDPRCQRVLSALAEIPNKMLVFIPKLSGYSIWTTANIVRLFPGCLGIPDDDYALVGDVDLWILRPSYIHDVQWDKPAHLWYSNAFATDAQYPMCHVGMTLKTWREVIGIQPSDIYKTVQKIMNLEGKGSDSDPFFNEKYFARKLHRWSGYPSKIQFISRPERKPEYPSDRLCRSNWDLAQLDTATDTHLPRPPKESRGLIWPVLCKVLTPEQVAWVDNYWR